MKVITSNICPPIPYRNHDWVAYFDGMEDQDPVGYGRTRKDAINDLIDNTDINDLARWFNIETREVGYVRGPEHGHWVAFTKDARVEAPWRDQAIADLAAKLISEAV